MTAGWQKIVPSNLSSTSTEPRISFVASARDLEVKLAALEAALTVAQTTGNAETIAAAQKALRENRVLRFNNLLDAAVAVIFMTLVALIALVSVREWILLLAHKRLAALRESEPVWLAEYAVAEGKPLRIFGLFALAFALAKELSGEAELERARRYDQACVCPHPEPTSAKVTLRQASRNSDERNREQQLYV